ncbi:MAG: TonB-dependent receptor, partial [Candidatus Zixiibacteriota bacterium]
DLSGQGATIRGIQGDRVLVLVDGERAVGRVRGSIDLSQFALNNVAKIEVVKGTGSTLYGSDAMGGVINIITKNPHRDYKRWNLYADYGTNRSLNPSAEFEYGNDKFGVVLGGKMYSTDGFDLDPSTPHTNGQEATDRWNFDGTMRADLSPRWKLTTSGRFMREERNWIESEDIDIINQFVYNDNETNYRYEAATGLQFISGDKYSMKFRVFGTLYDHTWKKIQQGTNFWLDTSKTQDKFFEASYSSNYVIGDGHVMTYGLQFNYQDLASTELSADKQADRSEAGYFQYEYAPVPQLTFLPGIRYEHHSSFGGHVNPSFNLMYQPSEQLKLRGFVGRGFRAPSIKEQYFIFDHSAAGYVVYGGLLGVPGVSANRFHPLKEETSINSSV